MKLDETEYKGFFSVEFESFNYYRNVLRNDLVKAAEISMEQIKELTKLLGKGDVIEDEGCVS